MKSYVDERDACPPDGFARVVPVVFATNDAYVPYMSVAIESIFQNASPENYYHIYVFYTDISQGHIELLESIQYRQGAIKCIDVSALIQSKGKLNYLTGRGTTKWITEEAYYRWLIPEVCACFDNVIYLDSDLVLQTDIAKIIPDAAADYLCAAVLNPLTPDIADKIKEYFDLDANAYVNSGVCVFNAQKWRQEGVAEQCFHLLRNRPPEKKIHCDQDILNMVCKGRMHYLHDGWNFQCALFYWDFETSPIIKSAIDRMRDDPKIIHFNGSKKPWSIPSHPLSKYFWQYARQTIFYEEILMREMHRMCAKRAQIEYSSSYRIGRTITFFPRKIRGGIRCYREHGLRYTFKRFCDKCRYRLGIQQVK